MSAGADRCPGTSAELVAWIPADDHAHANLTDAESDRQWLLSTGVVVSLKDGPLQCPGGRPMDSEWLHARRSTPPKLTPFEKDKIVKEYLVAMWFAPTCLMLWLMHWWLVPFAEFAGTPSARVSACTLRGARSVVMHWRVASWGNPVGWLLLVIDGLKVLQQWAQHWVLQLLRVDGSDLNYVDNQESFTRAQLWEPLLQLFGWDVCRDRLPQP